MGSPLAVYKSLILGDEVQERPEWRVDYDPAERISIIGADVGAVNERGASAAIECSFSALLYRDAAVETIPTFEARRRTFILALRTAVGRGNLYTARGPLVWASDRSTDWTTIDTTASASGSPVVLDLKKTIGLAPGDLLYLANRTTGQWQIATVSAVSGTDTTIPSLDFTATSVVTLAVKLEWYMSNAYPIDLPALTSDGSPLGSTTDLEFTFASVDASPITEQT